MRDPVSGAATVGGELFTRRGARLRLHGRSPGSMNWLLLPGGPGLGSESLVELADTISVPGAVWLVDLPGDGSNLAPPGARQDPYGCWPHVLAEVADTVADAVFVGHSTGGMYLLSVPELDRRLRGLALLSSAPDASWRAGFAAMTTRHPLPDVDLAARRFIDERSAENLRAVVVAAAPWNFPATSVAAGRAVLARLPYNPAAVAWSAAHFDDTYRHRWWPETMPTLICGGVDDRVVSQAVWDRPKFHGPNVLHRPIVHAGHFPWLDQPDAVRRAFADVAEALTGTVGDLVR